MYISIYGGWNPMVVAIHMYKTHACTQRLRYFLVWFQVLRPLMRWYGMRPFGATAGVFIVVGHTYGGWVRNPTDQFKTVVNIPLFTGFWPSFWWYRISQPSTIFLSGDSCKSSGSQNHSVGMATGQTGLTLVCLKHGSTNPSNNWGSEVTLRGEGVPVFFL